MRPKNMPVPNGIIGYDAAANRTSEQIDASVTQTGVNNLNQITGQTAGGATRFQGTISNRER